MFPLRFYQNICQSHQYTGSAKPLFFLHSFERNFDYCSRIIFLDFLSFTWLFENPDWLCRKIQVDWYKSNFQICIQ